MSRFVLLIALLIGVGLGWMGHAVLDSWHLDTAGTNGAQMYEAYRDMFRSVAQSFCPDDLRLVGNTDPLTAHSCVVPPEWYGPTAPHASSLLYEGHPSRPTQHSLGWVNDEEGYVIIVHMVFTKTDLGRGPLAFPSCNALVSPDAFRPDWNFVGTRDNVVFFFQLAPLEGVELAEYPNEWVERCCLFIEELRQFLDDEF